MTKILLDTHLYLWWLNDDQKLPPIVRDILNGDDVIVFVSVASFWEISIKSASGKLCVEHDRRARNGGCQSSSASWRSF
jgi:PIN domain nuclease of toxin-antitoxin system